MKVFITVEVDPNDFKKGGNGGMSESAFTNMMKLVDELRLEGIPTQYKSTNLPRRKRFKISADIADIES